MTYKDGYRTATKINEVCDLVRKELEKRDVFHFANTILTGHVRKSPPDYESALRVLVELKGPSSSTFSDTSKTDTGTSLAQDSNRAEDAVKYIIFLSDADKLFDLALGMYDFSLVLMIAQHSQKVRHFISLQYYSLTTFTGPSRIPPLPPRTSRVRDALPALQDRPSPLSLRECHSQPLQGGQAAL